MNLCTRCADQHKQTSHIIVEIKTAEKISHEFCQMEHDSNTDASLMCTDCESLMLCGNCADLHTKIPECEDHNVRDIPVKSKELLRHGTKSFTSEDDITCFCAICEIKKVGDLLCYNCGIWICDDCSLLYTGGNTDLGKHTFISSEKLSLGIERAKWIDQGTSKRKLLIAVLKFGISTIELSLSFSKDVVTNTKTAPAAFNLTKIFQDKCSLLNSFDDTYITFGSDAEKKLKLLLPNYKDFEENWSFYSEFSAETNNRIQEWKKRPSETKTLKNIEIMRNVVIQTIRKIQNKLNEDLMIRMLGIPRELIYWVIETPTGWDECFRSFLFPEIQKIGIKNTMISLITEQHASLHFFKNSEKKADEIFCRPGFINVYIEGQMFYVSDVLNDNNNIIIRKTIASHLPHQFPDILRKYFGTIVFNLIPLEELRNMTKEFDKQVETLSKRGPKEIPLSSAVIKIFNESSIKLKDSTGRRNDHLDVLFESNMILIRETYFEKVVKERIKRLMLKVVEMVDNRRDMQVMIIGEMFKSSYIQSWTTDICGNLKVVFFPEQISSMKGSVLSIFNQTYRNEGTDVISYDSDDDDSDSSV
ncbi:unnamed protein product [Mytilus edulis]|uniref:Uncharacterized protein n=1 Tax=Mytilus edulis TaxID=6550 RepID=A0A8S3SM07_MYTED|nr:unnamed protein product [Mytilus edulis]